MLLFQLNLEVRMKLLARWRARSRNESRICGFVAQISYWPKYFDVLTVLLYSTTTAATAGAAATAVPKKIPPKKYPTHRNVYVCVRVLCVHLFCNDSGDWIYMLSYERKGKKKWKKHTFSRRKELIGFHANTIHVVQSSVYNSRSHTHTHLLYNIAILSCIVSVCVWKGMAFVVYHLFNSSVLNTRNTFFSFFFLFSSLTIKRETTIKATYQCH